MSCSGYDCTARYNKKEPRSFRKLPDEEKNPNLRRKWIRATKRKKFKPTKSAVLNKLEIRHIAFPSFEKFRASCEIKSKTSAFSCLSLGQQQNPVVNTVSNQNGN